MLNMKISVITSLYKCKKYLPNFLNYLSNINNLSECEFIFVHNLPSEDELIIINKFISEHPNIRIKHIKLDFLETLYASWNRGILNSSGKYIAIWNVDDIRTPNSLKTQEVALDSDSEAMVCYGDFYEMKTYGKLEGKMNTYPEYKKLKKKLLRRHYIGCFPMWKREIHKTIGYFDEQFKLVGDFEFQIRMARKYKFVKSKEILGYYQVGNPNQLSKNIKLQYTERSIVDFRCGQFDKMNIFFFLRALKFYKVFTINNFNTNFSVKKVFKKYILYLLLKTYLVPINIFKIPIGFARYIKHVLLHRKMEKRFN